MRAATRRTVYTAVFCAAVLILAWKGTLDWMGITAVAVTMGLSPALIELVKLYLKGKKCDRDHRPD